MMLAAMPAQRPSYHVTARQVVGGEGSWDYITLDSHAHRLWITRGDHVQVIDPATGKVEADIPGSSVPTAWRLPMMPAERLPRRARTAPSA